MSTAKGKNGSISFDGILITISRGPTGGGWGTMVNQGVQGDRYIVARHLTAVEFRDAGRGSGFIAFDFPGKNPPRGGVFDALGDENAVVFTTDQAKEFAAIRDEILMSLSVPSKIDLI